MKALFKLLILSCLILIVNYKSIAQNHQTSPYDMFVRASGKNENFTNAGKTFLFRFAEEDSVTVIYEPSSQEVKFVYPDSKLKKLNLEVPKIVKWGVDPLTAHPNQIGKSPFSAFWGNPIYYVDLDGRCPECPDDVYVPIAQHVYTEDLKVGDKSSNGWEVVRIDENQKTGFKGAVYKGTYDGRTEYIYATQGTNPSSIKDWINNFLQVLGFAPQYKESVKYANERKNEFKGISFTGHSLGGGLASANALATNGKAVTFNAAGLSGFTKNELKIKDNKADITAYVVEGEAVSFYQAAVGLKAEGDIKRLPASYFIEIPFTNVDETIRMGQRIKNHFMDAIIEKFPKPKK